MNSSEEKEQLTPIPYHLLEKSQQEEISRLLRHIDSIQAPTNSDLNPLVKYLLATNFRDLQGHDQAERLVRASLRLRGRYLRVTSSKIRAWAEEEPLSGWLNMQTSRYLNN